MIHPKPEEWVSYVYGEADSATREPLREHLRNCPECRQEVGTWKRSLNRLDSWKLSRVRRSGPEVLLGWLRWSAATALVLLAGIWVGRTTAPQPDTARLRATLLPEIRQDLQDQTALLVRQELAKASSSTLAANQRYADRVGQQVYVALKKDLDTLAVNAAAGLRSTEEQLVQFADYNPPRTPLSQRPNQ